jgi:hypothetical protein
MLPMTIVGSNGVETSALLDTGAAVNVLPYSLGLQLGFRWERQAKAVELTGNLAGVESRIVVVSGIVAKFPAVRLVFAWARQDSMPVMLGQVNFFLEFDVCFFRARRVFALQPKQTS